MCQHSWGQFFSWWNLGAEGYSIGPTPRHRWKLEGSCSCLHCASCVHWDLGGPTCGRYWGSSGGLTHELGCVSIPGRQTSSLCSFLKYVYTWLFTIRTKFLLFLSVFTFTFPSKKTGRFRFLCWFFFEPQIYLSFPALFLFLICSYKFLIPSLKPSPKFQECSYLFKRVN